jgi:RNA polymerase sigma-70 factor (ECF subfamily)
MTVPGTAVSFDAFYRAEHPRVLGYFRRKAGREAAPDLAQEVFTRLLRSGAFERADCPQAYLSRIARNLLIDRSRRKKSSPTTCYQFDDARDAASCADQSWRIEAADLSHLYRRTVRGMPPKTRRVFLMRRVRRMSYKEIAAALGITVATVDYHLVRALAQCRAAIAEQC